MFEIKNKNFNHTRIDTKNSDKNLQSTKCIFHLGCHIRTLISYLFSLCASYEKKQTLMQID